jgi:hypothetical protein
MQLNKDILTAKERRFKTTLWELINRDYREVIVSIISISFDFVFFCK